MPRYLLKPQSNIQLSILFAGVKPPHCQDEIPYIYYPLPLPRWLQKSHRLGNMLSYHAELTETHITLVH